MRSLHSLLSGPRGHKVVRWPFVICARVWHSLGCSALSACGTSDLNCVYAMPAERVTQTLVDACAQQVFVEFLCSSQRCYFAGRLQSAALTSQAQLCLAIDPDCFREHK